MHNTMTLSLNSDTLNSFKMDFDNILRQTISKMLENNEVEGSLSAKITILLVKMVDEDGQEYTRPVLKHDVKSVVQAKSSAQGALMGDYALEWNPELCQYALVPSDQRQMSLFDE